MNRRDCGGRTDDAHVFTCPACRVDARIAAAWKGLRIEETPVPADDVFIRRVVLGVTRNRRTRARLRWVAAAAAAALFSFFAGLAHEHASQPSPTPEDSYAALTTPSALEGWVPN
jgi:hypothetical protein